MDLTLNGNLLGDLAPSANWDGSARSWQDWYANCCDSANGFTITGDIVLTGTQPNGDNNRFEIKFGNDPSAACAVPAPGAILLAGLGTAIAGRFRRRSL